MSQKTNELAKQLEHSERAGSTYTPPGRINAFGSLMVQSTHVKSLD